MTEQPLKELLLALYQEQDALLTKLRNCNKNQTAIVIAELDELGQRIEAAEAAREGTTA